jgi:DNA-binding SARP family transcriptional activator
VFVDADAFEAAAGTARRSKDPRAYALALQLYAGELLPQDRYADWTARPREMLRDLQLDLLSELGKLHLERGQYQQAIDAFVRVVAEEPTHEQAVISLMRLYAAMGQRWKALHEYARLQSALRDELDVEPEATTRQLYSDILAGSNGPQFQFGASQVNFTHAARGRHQPPSRADRGQKFGATCRLVKVAQTPS